MNISSGRAMVYVYRKEMLCRNLRDREISDFLMNAGYNLSDVDSVVRCLRKRIVSGDLPHEVGLFLGYPLHDVIGFIENKGKNYICLGCWKVYCDECGAKKKFCQYKACKNKYIQMFESGKSISELACSA